MPSSEDKYCEVKSYVNSFIHYTAFFSMHGLCKEVKEVEKNLHYDLKPQVCHFDCHHFTISEAKSEATWIIDWS